MDLNKLNKVKKIYYHVYLVFWSIFYIVFFGYSINYEKIFKTEIISYNMNEYLDIIDSQHLSKLNKYLQNYILVNIFLKFCVPQITNNFYENLITDIFDYSILELGKLNNNILKIFMIYQSFNWFLFINILSFYKYIPKNLFKYYIRFRDLKIVMVLIIITKSNIFNCIYNNLSNNIIINIISIIINLFCFYIVGRVILEKYFIKNKIN